MLHTRFLAEPHLCTAISLTPNADPATSYKFAANEGSPLNSCLSGLARGRVRGGRQRLQNAYSIPP